MTIENQKTGIREWFRDSITFKLISIGILMLLLLIPDSMISELILERQTRVEEANIDISESYGGHQQITGPILCIPYQYKTEVNDKWIIEKDIAYLLPEELHIQSDLTHEIRQRGIFEAVVYNAEVNLSGFFSFESFSGLSLSDENVFWNEAFVAFGISGMTGIKDRVEMTIGSDLIRFESGLRSCKLLTSGLSGKYSLSGIPLDEDLSFSIPVQLRGAGSLQFEPVGEVTKISMQSDWHSPSFTGNFLPVSREISKDGFTADWSVLSMNRNYPQAWLGNQHFFQEDLFGVTLLQPVDEYQKSTRASKYAFLIIGMTFLLYFFFETIRGLRIHPVQYLFVGLAIIIFFLLLISLSEHIGFDIAYLISSVTTVGLICFYSFYVLKIKRLVIQVGLILSILYAFIFVILQMEDFALLVGSLVVFAALALVMYYSRNVDWYRIRKSESV